MPEIVGGGGISKGVIGILELSDAEVILERVDEEEFRLFIIRFFNPVIVIEVSRGELSEVHDLVKRALEGKETPPKGTKVVKPKFPEGSVLKKEGGLGT